MNVLIGFLLWFNSAFGDNQTDVNIYLNPDSGALKVMLIGIIPSDCNRLEIKVNQNGEIGYCCVETDDGH